MRIATNVMSLSARNAASRTTTSLAQAVERLSSGLRVNSAKDDAAGLAIASRFTSQIRGINQAVRNLNDAVSYTQTAEAAVAGISNLLQRGRELAVQANNASNSASDRASLQAEISEILSEVDRITAQSAFNGQKLFEQGMASTPTTSITFYDDKRQILENLQRGWLSQSEDLVESYYGLSAPGVDLTIVLDDTIASASAFVTGTGASTLTNLELHVDVQEFIGVGIAYPQNSIDQLIAHEMTHAVMAATTNFANLQDWFREGAAELLPGGDARLASVLGGSSAAAVAARLAGIDSGGFTGSDLDYATSYASMRYLNDAVSGGLKSVMNFLSADTTRTLDDFFTSGAMTGVTSSAEFITDFGSNGAAYISAMNLSNDDTGGIGGPDASGGGRDTSFAEAVPDPDATASQDPLSGFDEVWPDLIDDVVLEENHPLAFQAGGNSGETLVMSGRFLSTEVLRIEEVNVTTNANDAIQRFDQAIDALSGLRAEYGAYMNRFESAIRSARGTGENLSAGRSRIMDTDFAHETAEFTRAQILQQASTTMIAQANVAPQLALRLLR